MNDIEIKLLKVWQDTLEVDTLDLESDFFQIGGTSLLATKLMFKVYEIFSIEVPLDLLSGGLTIKKMAEEIQKQEVSLKEREVGEI